MKICSKCGVSKPLTEYSKSSRAKDGYKTACSQCRAIEYRTYLQANREKVQARQKAWNAANPEKRRAIYAKYRSVNLDKVRKSRAKWAKENPQASINNRHKRRAAVRHNGKFRVTKADLKRLYSQPCFYCGGTDRITLDHVIPITRGGTHSIGNLVPACLSCNSQKRHRTITEWRKAKKAAA